MTTPNLATGGSRIYNLPDVIANLNDDVDQANAPDLTDTTAFTNLVSGFEQANMVDTPAAGAFTLPTWGTGQWGLAVWS
jgi:hypothetical protein